MSSFFKRIMPKLMFTPMSVINGSLEYTVEYLVQAAEWISNLLQTTSGGTAVLTPFQFDLCIAVGEPKPCDDMVGDDDQDNNDDDDDEDNNDDEKQDYVDYIGDIGAKLGNNKLKNTKKEIAAKAGMDRVFDDLYKDFLAQNKEQDITDKKSYLHSKRLIAMVDRRKQAKEVNPELTDDVFMYEPPADSLMVPRDAVPEWFVASSRTCLLPGLNVCSPYMFPEHSGNSFKFRCVSVVNRSTSVLSLNVSECGFVCKSW